MDRFSALTKALADTETSEAEDLLALRRVLFQEPPSPAEKLKDEYREIIDRAQRKSSQTDLAHSLCR